MRAFRLRHECFQLTPEFYAADFLVSQTVR